MSDIPLEDHKEFEDWLLARWAEKDQLLEECFKKGSFPSELAGSIETNGQSERQKTAASEGYVETYVKLHHWVELGQIVSVVTGIAVLYKVARKVWSLWRTRS